MSLSQYHGKSPQELDHTSRAYTGQRTISIALFLSVLYLTSNGPITVATMQLKAKDIATKRFSPMRIVIMTDSLLFQIQMNEHN